MATVGRQPLLTTASGAFFAATVGREKQVTYLVERAVVPPVDLGEFLDEEFLQFPRI